MIDLKTLTVKKAHEAIKSGEYSAVELANAYLDVIKEKNKELNAYLEVYEDVIDQAKGADKKFKDGTADLMTGIPVSIKDNILFEGHKASAASKILENYTATYDSNAVKKLKESGAVILGRTNMDEFAMGSSTENSAFGVTKNPIDTSRVTGGSSGGSAASVAGDLALVSLGSDTGGSVRQPASFCGVVGLKPTYGSISRSGLIAMGSSLDIIGQFGKNISDVEILFNTVKGKDNLDSTSISPPTPGVGGEEEKKVIGIPKFSTTGRSASGGKNYNVDLSEAKSNLEKLGYKVKEIDLPSLSYSLSAYYIIMPAEVSSNMSRFDGVKYGLHKEGENLIGDYFKTRGEGLGTEVKRRILLGTYVLSAGYSDEYYYKAIALRNKIKEEFRKAFEEVDLIMTPTTPGPAFKIGEKVGDPISMYLEDIFTVPANITGSPAISLPFGEQNGMPLGIQLIAPHQREDLLFQVGKKFLGEE
jgi:aspartyl-tRNA(Asn)/glutamyl-tRNA(Gln) amidotransferase subunit A